MVLLFYLPQRGWAGQPEPLGFFYCLNLKNIMINLTAVWEQVESLLQDGFSLVPVRDKDDDTGVVKQPYSSWKEYQFKIIEKQQLWAEMEQHNTTAVGIICGAISGNLEVIDIDVKHKTGVDALIFGDIKAFYPELWERLRVHQSRNKGYHIPYRISEPVPRSMKLAGRYTTDEEKQKWLSKHPNAKKALGEVNFLETRGEGGMIVCPPSVGYKVVRDNPFPLLTMDERNALINICRKYHEIVKVESIPKSTKRDLDYYEQNPFEDFNQRADATKIMEDAGWTYQHGNSAYLLYTRPGGKKGDTHASFDRGKRFFTIFTTSTDIDSDKRYQPATMLSLLQHNGDRKKTYAYLVQEGYGVMKPQKERQIVKRAALSGGKLPANISETSQAEFTAIVEDRTQKHPYGVFWEYDEDSKLYISREDLYSVADGLGFKLYNGQLMRIVAPFIHAQEERDFFEAIKEYVKEEDGDLYKDICNAYEAYIERHGKFTISRLRVIDETEVMRDTRYKCNKFYLNGFLHITKDEIALLPYSSADGLIVHSRLQQRDFIEQDEADISGVYPEFLRLATGGITIHLKRILGYLAHEYRDETTAYIVLCIEICADPKHGGGSGKNVFCKLLEHTTTYISKPGSQTNMDEKFFQVWNGQRIFAISDLPKDFDFAFLKEPSSGDFVWKKLFKDEKTIGVENGPKFIAQTNFSYVCTDGGLARRLIPLEFTDFFTKCGGLDTHFGKHFPKDWTVDDWSGYDFFIACCVKEWLAAGRKIKANALSDTGAEKQFIQTFGQTTHDIIQEYWVGWLDKAFVSNEDFKTQIERFCIENSIPIGYRPSMIKINAAVADYANRMGVVFQKDFVKREGPTLMKGRLFTHPSQSDIPF